MQDFLIVAHRGGLFNRPENTLAAFDYCLEHQITWVECDIRLSKDEVPVLIHDDRLEMPHGNMRSVRDMTFKELSSIDVGGGEHIPTLKMFLERFRDNLRFVIEFKELDGTRRVIKLIKKLGVEDRVILQSFIPDVLQIAKDTAPEIPRGFLVDRIAARLAGQRSVINAATLLKCHYFMPHHLLLNSKLTSAAHDEGLKVLPWTVNRDEDVARMLELGVDGIITDRPKHFQKVIRKQIVDR
ncbi:MAG: glycerophosphodiester phosphodiesterase [Calditrichaeota bacterium]|jgi:glycerophosphoryl diester phosphodiesterase|nr:glycerophosphodiester phosphodiesterase [Calditrichota bacterium]MBT7617829.1 glycerophosphodiester phosphodiesterase [Calditrichota bacterium]MBT7787969.1 glycerophosphodiester phosphodiesterase [Calditrichota bacterium]